MTVVAIDPQNALKRFLPHGREALIKGLWITRLTPGSSATGYVHFQPGSEYFRGHFPGSPCLPFHIVLETAHQVMQVAILSALSDEERAKFRPLCWRWDEPRLADQILPNEVLKMFAQIRDPQPLALTPESRGIKVIIGDCLGMKVVGEKRVFTGTAYFSLALQNKIKSNGV